MDKLTSGHEAYPRLADATRSGRPGYFEITYRPPRMADRTLCLMACGFENAVEIFNAFGIGEAVQTREITPEAFMNWYGAMAKRTREAMEEP